MLQPEKPSSPPAAPVAEPVQLLDADLRRIGKIIGVMIIILLGLYLLRLVWPAIEVLVYTALPFVVALILAYILNPIVNFLQDRLRVTRVGAVMILHVLIFAVIAAFFAVILPILVEQIRNAWTGLADFAQNRFPELREYVDALREWLGTQGIDPDTFLADFLRSQGVTDAAKNAASSGLGALRDALLYLLAIVRRLVGFAVGLSFVVLVNIYLLMDFSKVRRVMEIVIPSRHQPRAFALMGRMDEAVGGFLRGMLIDAFLVGLLQFVGLYLLGLKQYALLLGIVAGIGNFIPYLGPIAGGVPAILYVMFSGTYESSERTLYLVLVGGLLVLVQTLEGFVFQPKIVGKNAQLSPIVVLFALAFGSNFGIFGMVVAVPLACMARVLVKEFYWDRRVARWETRRAAGPTGASAGGGDAAAPGAPPPP